jgi:hypothetical protein
LSEERDSMEFKEAVAPPVIHVDEKCPFCPVDKKPNDKIVAKIGEDNAPSTLGKNLIAAGIPKKDYLEDEDDVLAYGEFSAEAHHLICGNEVLKEEGEVEKYLIKEARQTSKGAAGLLKPRDVPYDVNAAENGIWLPSTRDEFRITKRGQPPESGTLWSGLEESEKENDAFAVMEGVKRQFHKGSHGNAGQPHNNYVKEAIARLKQVRVWVSKYSEICPMEEDAPKKEPPYYPPDGIVDMLNLLSANLRKELIGPPETWNFFISDLAWKCHLHNKELYG